MALSKIVSFLILGLRSEHFRIDIQLLASKRNRPDIVLGTYSASACERKKLLFGIKATIIIENCPLIPVVLQKILQFFKPSLGSPGGRKR